MGHYSMGVTGILLLDAFTQPKEASVPESTDQGPRQYALESLANDLETLRSTIRLFLLSDMPLHGVTRLAGASACRALEAFGGSIMDEMLDERNQAIQRARLADELPEHPDVAR